jgi:hypothetical protein
MKKMIRTIAVLAFAFAASTMWAQSPHFIKAPRARLDANTGDYCVSFKEAGLGSTPITYTITAGDGTVFTYQCFTKSGNNPQGDPNGISGSGESTSTTVTPRHGHVTATICLEPDQDGASCQGQGLTLRLIGVNYQNVVFCDQTNNVCFNVPDACSGAGCE